jgi:hypothetical protein
MHMRGNNVALVVACLVVAFLGGAVSNLLFSARRTEAAENEDVLRASKLLLSNAGRSSAVLTSDLFGKATHFWLAQVIPDGLYGERDRDAVQGQTSVMLDGSIESAQLTLGRKYWGRIVLAVTDKGPSIQMYDRLDKKIASLP